MKHIFSISILFVLLFGNSVFAQPNINEIRAELIEINSKTTDLQGLVLDKNKQVVLPFTNIVFLHKNKGTISNEDGYFTINSSLLNSNDSISIQYMGYINLNITLADFRKDPVIYLEENIFNLNEIFVFGTEPNAKKIIEKVIENKDKNYANISSKTKAFVRQRDTDDINHFTLKFKKSTFKSINKKINKLIEQKMPKHSTSFTDFLGYLYQSETENDTLNLKIKPIQMVALKGEDIDYSQLEDIFEKLFKNTDDNEYWKVKSGLLGTKIELDEEDTADTESPKQDSVELNDNEMHMYYYQRKLESSLNFITFKNEKQWEFLYKTGRYKYTLVGGTTVDGEEVYIIDFEPDDSGIYEGRVFISIATNALIRADYEYAPGKDGFNIHLLGVMVSENKYKASIYFEKDKESYRLKYFSLKTGQVVGVNRDIALIKKKKRFLFDKKLHEYKVRLKMKQTSEQYIELLVMDEEEITNKQYSSYIPDTKMKVIYVKQFDDSLWNDFSIIAPTKQMKDYKNLE